MRLKLNVDVCGEECEPPSDHLGGEVAKGRSRDKIDDTWAICTLYLAE